MKKTLKLVAILISVLVVVIVGGLSIYFVAQNNKTFYIYDLRIVEPVSGQYDFVYTNSEQKYKSIKNRSVYLRSNSQNRFEIGVYANTSNGMTNVYPTSSNENVAKIVYSNNSCYVQYQKAGKATISVSIGTVTDSFELTVYDIVADSFTVFDDNYYGEFSSYYPNKLIAYSDGLQYSYNYEAKSSQESNSYAVNNDMLRVVNVDESIIESATINPKNQKLLIKCKSGFTKDIDTTITVQSYTISESGKIKVLGSQNISIHIVAHTPEFLQLELSTTPDFEDKCVFVDTIKVDASDFDEDQIKNHLESYLDYKKTEQNLANAGEKAVYNTYFSQKVNKLYLRLRKVYTNGEVVVLTPNDAENPYILTANSSNLKLSSNSSYYILTLSESDFASGTFDIDLKLNGENYLQHTFKFEYVKFDKESITKLYDYKDGVFTYKYWDERTHFANEIFDSEGNIIGFVGIDTSSFESVEG